MNDMAKNLAKAACGIAVMAFGIYLMKVNSLPQGSIGKMILGGFLLAGGWDYAIMKSFPVSVISLVALVILMIDRGVALMPVIMCIASALAIIYHYRKWKLE